MSVVFLFVFSTLAIAIGEDSIEEVIDKLQKRYEKTKDYSAVFTQETISKNLDAPAIVNGNVYFKKPGMIKWEYTDPIKQEIISDGETLWLYLPDDNQVRIYDAAEALKDQTFFSFLFGEGNITDDFEAVLGDPGPEQADEYYLIMLAPKRADTSIDRILLLVDKEKFLIHQINTYDVLGNVTRVAFEDISVNSGLKDSMFHFIVPAGVEMIKIESSPQEMPKTEIEVEIIETED